MSWFVDVGVVKWAGEEVPIYRGPIPGIWAERLPDDPTEGWLEEGEEKEAAAEAPLGVFSESARTIPFIASEQTPDRGGDVVMARGMDLRDFRKNPVLMPFHKHDAFPLGTVPRIRPVGNQIRGVAKFSSVPGNTDAHIAFGMMWEGELKGFSVGFLERVSKLMKATKGEDDDRDNLVVRLPGRLFQKSVLLEMSVAPIPAHANALASRNRKDSSYLARHLAEAIVGHSKEHLDEGAALDVVAEFVQRMAEAAAQPERPEVDPAAPEATAKAQEEPRDADDQPDSRQVEEVAQEAAAHILKKFSF